MTAEAVGVAVAATVCAVACPTPEPVAANAALDIPTGDATQATVVNNVATAARRNMNLISPALVGLALYPGQGQNDVERLGLAPVRCSTGHVVALVAPAATLMVSPVAVASTVTLLDGQVVMLLEVTAPEDIAVNVTA